MARDPDHELWKRYEKSLGVELGSLFAELWQELVWLHTVWQEYRVIFDAAPEQLEIANRARIFLLHSSKDDLGRDTTPFSAND